MSHHRSASFLVFLLSTTLFLSLLPGFSLPAVLTLVQRDWGMGPGQAGVVIAAFQAGYILAAIIALPLTDRYDARWIIAGGAAVCTAGHLAFAAMAHDPLTGTILRALAGAGLGGVYMPGLRLASMVPSMKGRAVGLYVSSYLFGTAFSFAVTGALAALVPWQSAYLAVSVVSGLALVAGLWLIRSPMPEGITAVPPRPARAEDRVREQFSFRARLPVILVIGAYIAHMWELYGLRSWLAPFMVAAAGGETAGAAARGALLASLSVVLSATSTIIAGWLSDRLGRSLTAAVILTASAACSFVFGWLLSAPFWLIAVIGVVYSLTVAADSPIFSTSLTELVPSEKLGHVMAWQTFLGYGAATLSPAAFGFILESFPGTQGWGLAFGLLGAGAVLGPGLMLILRRFPESARLCSGKR
ncbi:MAG: MFS transporter [Thermoanaerobacterales bacterium]|nr:MFS transporter [Thermoanaerobacterales bacterium]